MTAQLGENRPRLVVVDDLRLTSLADAYLSMRALATYAGVSVRWLRDKLTDAHHPLPHFRLPGGKILVKRGDYDAWMARYRQVGRPDVNAIVKDVLQDLAR
jgi:hypothetical protein